MSIVNINSDTTLTWGSSFYFIDASTNNINLTIPEMLNDLQFYNIYRIDSNDTNTVSIILDSSTLITGESTFNLYAKANITIMSTNNVWAIISGYSKDR